MKLIKYKIRKIIRGQEMIFEKCIGYSEANLAVALKEAFNGEYAIEGSEPEAPANDPDVWDELAAALREGVNAV